MVDVQLKVFMARHNITHSSQHGFTAGRSTLTNLLTADAHAANIISLNHSYNIVSFDFIKAFDKTSHQYVLKTLSELSIKGKALEWFSRFLSNLIFQVSVGGCFLPPCNVTSGIIQESELDPNLYTILLIHYSYDCVCLLRHLLMTLSLLPTLMSTTCYLSNRK